MGTKVEIVEAVEPEDSIGEADLIQLQIGGLIL